MPYADKEKQKEYVRNWTKDYYRRKRAEQKRLEEGYNRLYHENIELKKMLKEKSCNKTEKVTE